MQVTPKYRVHLAKNKSVGFKLQVKPKFMVHLAKNESVGLKVQVSPNFIVQTPIFSIRYNVIIYFLIFLYLLQAEEM